MSGYKRPEVKLHREFIYLNHDTVINSLSAFEAGQVDEILEKVTEAREGGVEGSLGYGPIKAGGSKKKTANFEEELRRTRTVFSAFDGWMRFLDERHAFGELSDWDVATRNELQVGDTIKLSAHVSLSPVQRVLLTFIDFANQAANPDSPLKQPASEVAATKKTARMMSGWMSDSSGAKSVLVSIAPLGFNEPRVFARLDERYLVNGLGGVEGDFTLIAQVETLVAASEAVPAIRVLRETPPTPLETETITDAMKSFIEPAATLGVVIDPSDITIEAPAVLLHPIAIYR